MKFNDHRIEPYLPSIQPTWLRALSKGLYEHRSNVPHGSFAALDEFNWFSGENPRFSHRSALYSPGHAELDLDKAAKSEPLLFERDRGSTFLLTDSGGFQVGMGHWPLTDIKSQLLKVLRWQEAVADLAVVLEVPRWGTQNGQAIGFDKALELTKINLEGYRAHAKTDLKFLNILHGDNFDECRRWFDATRSFNDDGHAVGWCFGSRSANDLHLAIEMLIYMLSQDHQPQYLHFLGKGTPQSIVIADIMRRTVPKAFKRDGPWNRQKHGIIITADASSEFQTSGRFGSIYERTVDKTNGDIDIAPIQIKTAKFESSDPQRFPGDRTYPDVQGPILGRHHKGVKFGDILDPLAFSGESKSAYNLDEVSLLILIAHNVWVKKDATDELIRIEGALRRLEYGKQDNATADMAEMMARLVHSSSEKGLVDALGERLVACTTGLWKVFGYTPPAEMEAADILQQRLALLQTFERDAKLVLGKDYDKEEACSSA